MLTRMTLIFASACTVASAGVRSGRATADWLTASQTFTPGKQVQTAVKLVLDDHWHTYWLNPGEGGMKMSIKWELPPGWKAGEPEHPVPKRFMTADLPGFGYEGTVLFPVALTPPGDFKGEAKLKAKVSWLTCNDDSCVPGDAELELTLKEGEFSASPDVRAVTEAAEAAPKPAEGMTLSVAPGPEKLALTLKLKSGASPQPGECEVFPVTPQVVDAKAAIQFSSDGAGIWTVEVPKSEYLTHAPKELSLLLAPKSGAPPVVVSWKAD